MMRQQNWIGLVLSGLLVLNSCGSTPGPQTLSIASLSPSTGPATGGTAVTFIGTGFQNVTSVKFGAQSATFTIASDQKLSALSPPGNGNATVSVTAKDGSQATTSFTYTAPVVTQAPLMLVKLPASDTGPELALTNGAGLSIQAFMAESQDFTGVKLIVPQQAIFQNTRTGESVRTYFSSDGFIERIQNEVDGTFATMRVVSESRYDTLYFKASGEYASGVAILRAKDGLSYAEIGADGSLGTAQPVPKKIADWASQAVGSDLNALAFTPGEQKGLDIALSFVAGSVGALIGVSAGLVAIPAALAGGIVAAAITYAGLQGEWAKRFANATNGMLDGLNNLGTTGSEALREALNRTGDLNTALKDLADRGFDEARDVVAKLNEVKTLPQPKNPPPPPTSNFILTVTGPAVIPVGSTGVLLTTISGVIQGPVQYVVTGYTSGSVTGTLSGAGRNFQTPITVSCGSPSGCTASTSTFTIRMTDATGRTSSASHTHFTPATASP